MNRENEKRKQFQLGEQVWLKGTGEYWAGHQFSANIVDIQPPGRGEKADTIKVQYPIACAIC